MVKLHFLWLLIACSPCSNTCQNTLGQNITFCQKIRCFGKSVSQSLPSRSFNVSSVSESQFLRASASQNFSVKEFQFFKVSVSQIQVSVSKSFSLLESQCLSLESQYLSAFKKGLSISVSLKRVSGSQSLSISVHQCLNVSDFHLLQVSVSQQRVSVFLDKN